MNIFANFNINKQKYFPSKYIWLLVLVYSLGIADTLLMAMFNFLAVPLQKFYNDSIENHYGVYLDEASYSILISIIGNISTLSSIITIIFIVPKMDSLGRKFIALHIRNIIVILASMCFIAAKLFLSIEFFFIGQIFLGLNDPIKFALVRLYISECAPSATRGFFTECLASFLNIYIIFASILMRPNIFGNDENWHYIALVTLVLTIISYILGIFLPESPKYLYFKHADKRKVIKIIQTYQGRDSDIDIILQSYEKEMKITHDNTLGLKEIWQNTALKKSIILILILAFAGMANMTIILASYETSLLISFGFTQSSVMYLINGMSILNFPLAMLGPILIEKLGRRPLILLASCIQTLLPIIGCIGKILSDAMGPNEWSVLLGIIVVLVQLISSVCAYNSIVYILLVDLIPTGAKAVISQLIAVIMTFATFIPVFLYPNLAQFMGGFAFLPFSLLQFGFFIYFYYNLLETKQKEVFENVEILQGQIRSRAQTRRMNSSRKIRASTLVPLIRNESLDKRKKSRYNSINFDFN